MIGIKDINGVPVSEGNIVEIKVKTWNGYIEICKGRVEFVALSHQRADHLE